MNGSAHTPQETRALWLGTLLGLLGVAVFALTLPVTGSLPGGDAADTPGEDAARVTTGTGRSAR